MNVLVACENSQTVCKAFRDRGYNAFSCDITPSYGGCPQWHIKGDVRLFLGLNVEFFTESGQYYRISKWDLIIAHPPCTYLSNVATKFHSLKYSGLNDISIRTMFRIEAQKFFMLFVNAQCDKIAIENPVDIMSTVYRKPDQIIHPYQFAKDVNDKENYVTKRTCLWLKGLNPLITNYIVRDESKLFDLTKNGKKINWYDKVSVKDRSKIRSKTFPGIAKAMAEQWGNI